MATLWTMEELELVQAIVGTMTRRKLSRKQAVAMLRKIAQAMEDEERRIGLLAVIQAEILLEGGQHDD